MIAIVNVSEFGTRDDEPNLYEIRINRKVVARFKHVRTDDLATCLRLAADAAEKGSILAPANRPWQDVIAEAGEKSHNDRLILQEFLDRLDVKIGKALSLSREQMK